MQQVTAYATLRMQYPKVFELSLIITLILVTTFFAAWKEYHPPIVRTTAARITLQVEDIPITHQIKRPPPPPKPQIPISSDDPLLVEDIPMPNLGEWIDITPPPPPPVEPDVVPFYTVETPPQMVGGIKALYNCIMENDLFPAMAIKTGTNGFCTIRFTVNRKGQAVDITVENESPL